MLEESTQDQGKNHWDEENIKRLTAHSRPSIVCVSTHQGAKPLNQTGYPEGYCLTS